jgi:hypothetical protein
VKTGFCVFSYFDFTLLYREQTGVRKSTPSVQSEQVWKKISDKSEISDTLEFNWPEKIVGKNDFVGSAAKVLLRTSTMRRDAANCLRPAVSTAFHRSLVFNKALLSNCGGGLCIEFKVFRISGNPSFLSTFDLLGPLPNTLLRS